MRKRLQIGCYIALALFVAAGIGGCGGGGGGGTTVPDTPINTLDGKTGIPVNSTFTYTFTKAADTATITAATFFIMPTPASVAAQVVGKAAYDAGICDAAQALAASISFGSSTTATLDPANDLDYNARYTVCMTPDIAYADGTAFEGLMAHFTTEEGGEPATYTVGGTVSGLAGTVVLQNNGADDMSIEADGAFTFTTPIADGSAYGVTVLTQPTEKTCVVIDGSGTISGANVTDVAVDCKSWTYPSSLSDHISAAGFAINSYPRVAMDDAGNTIVVWSQATSTNQRVFKTEYRSGAWSTPDDDVNVGTTNTSYPEVAMDSSGNAIIVWQQSDGASNQIFKSEYRGGAWTYPSGVTDNLSPDGQPAFFPQVAMDDDGNAIVVWVQSDGANDQIFKSEYRSGVWTNPSGLTDNISPDGQPAADPRVAMDNNGNAIIVWQQPNGGFGQLYMKEYRDGAWAAPVKISPSGTHVYDQTVAMDDNGNALIAWYQLDDTGDNAIFLSEYRDGAWTHPASTADYINPPGTGSDAYDPQIAMDDDGNAVIVWSQYALGPDIYKIFKSEYRGGAWTHPSGMADNISPAGDDADYPVVATDGNGNAVVMWVQDTLANRMVFKSEYRDGAWAHPADLEDYISINGQQIYEVYLAMSANGDAVVVWRQKDGGGVDDQVFLSEFR